MANFKNNLIFWSIPAGLFLAWYLKDILFVILTGLIFGLAIQEWSLWLKNKIKLPFHLIVSFIYLIILFLFIVSIYFLAPVTISQAKQIFPNLVDYIKSFGLKDTESYLKDLFDKPTPDLLIKTFSSFLNIIGGLFNVILILVISFYISTQVKFINKFFFQILKKEEYYNMYLRIKRKLALWLIGQIFLMFSVGISTFILLFILQIPYAKLLGLIAGLTELIPIIGPIIAASIAIIITFSYDPNLVLWVLGGFVLIQQLENNFLVPIVARYILNIPPVFTLSAILIGGKLGGILGIITVVPLMALGIAVYKELS